MEILDVGRASYEPVWRLQHELVRRRKAGTVGDVLVLVEHEPVITLGRSADESNITASPDRLRRLGVEVRRVERGGDVTYHGPGQLVGYPILDLRRHRKDVRWYVRSLEEVLIRALGNFGIEAERDTDNIGVWIDGKKIAAIGARIEKWVTYHGFALNVDPDMSHFDLIVPCGIPDLSVTSMSQILGYAPSMDSVKAAVARSFESVLVFGSHETELGSHGVRASGPGIRQRLQSGDLA